MRKSGGADEFVAEYAAEEWVWGGALLARPTSARQKPARWKRAGRRMSVWPSSCWVLRIGVLARISSTGIACAPGFARLKLPGGNVPNSVCLSLPGCGALVFSEVWQPAVNRQFLVGRFGKVLAQRLLPGAGALSLTRLFLALRIPPQFRALHIPPEFQALRVLRRSRALRMLPRLRMCSCCVAARCRGPSPRPTSWKNMREPVDMRGQSAWIARVDRRSKTSKMRSR